MKSLVTDPVLYFDDHSAYREIYDVVIQSYYSLYSTTSEQAGCTETKTQASSQRKALVLYELLIVLANVLPCQEVNLIVSWEKKLITVEARNFNCKGEFNCQVWRAEEHRWISLKLLAFSVMTSLQAFKLQSIGND